MKLIRAKIEVTHPDAKSTQYHHPKVWLDHKESIPAVMDDDRPDETQENGKFYKTLHAVVPDDVYDTFLKHPETFSSPDNAELIAKTEKNWPKKQIINRELIDPILVKFVRGEELSQKDKDALDQNHPEKGVTMSDNFIEVATKYGCDNI